MGTTPRIRRWSSLGRRARTARQPAGGCHESTMSRPASWGSGRQHRKGSNPYCQCIVDRAVPIQIKSLRVRDMDVGRLRIRRNSSESVRSEYSRTLLQPEGRHRIAHGASHGNSACAEEPPEGAEDGGVRSFAPCRGFTNLVIPPWLTPWAMFCRSASFASEHCRNPHFLVAHSNPPLAHICSECYNRVRIPEIAGTPRGQEPCASAHNTPSLAGVSCRPAWPAPGWQEV